MEVATMRKFREEAAGFFKETAPVYVTGQFESQGLSLEWPNKYLKGLTED